MAKIQTVMINEEPFDLLVVVDSDLDIYVYGIPTLEFEEKEMKKYDGYEKGSLPSEILEKIDNEVYIQINAITVPSL